MFKSAATKIAHNSTLPGLAGNNELKTLQELIIAEKTVINSLDRLTTDFAKAADALRSWGLGEGDDLGDILSGSASLLLHFCTVITHLSSHTQTIRAHMKSIRTREESLLALHRRHKSLQSKYESADKKASKMNPENKNLQAQMELINKLCEEITDVEGEIMAEEAALGDYKRTKVKEWMGIQFGGVGECGEVGVLIAHYGKLLIESIPLGTTQPGFVREVYTAQDQTRQITGEADTAIRRVEFSTFPSSTLPTFPDAGASASVVYPQNNNIPDRYQSPDNNQTIHAPSPLPPPAHPSMLSSSSPTSMPEPSSYLPPPIHPRVPSSTSSRSRPSSLLSWRPSVLGGESRVENYSLDPIQTGGGLGIGQFIDGTDEFGVASNVGSSSRTLSASSGSGPSSGPGTRRNGRFATFPVKSRTKEVEAREGRRSEESQSAEGLPAYTPLDLNLGGGLQVEPLTLGADQDSGNQGAERNEHEAQEEEDVGLAYMSPTAESPLPSPMHSRFGAVSEGTGAASNGDDAGNVGRENGSLTVNRADRRIRFKSGATDIDEAMERRVEAEAERQQESSRLPSSYGGESQNQNESASSTQQLPPPRPPQQQPERIPTPPSETETDERSLNAAAAREISRELDALLFSPPATVSGGMTRSNGLAPPPAGKVTSEDVGAGAGLDVGQDQQVQQSSRSPSPLMPPAPPFASNSPGVGQTNYGQVTARKDSFGSMDKERKTSPPPLSPRAGQPLPSTPPVAQNLGSGSQALPPPPIINFPNRSTSPPTSATSTPYRTPPEYPRPSYSSLPRPNLASLSSSNLSSGMPSVPSSPLMPPAPGTKTISVSAFRRQMRSPSGGSATSIPGVADTSPLNFAKRSLPSSPYPPGAGARGRTGSTSSGGDRTAPPPAPAADGEAGDDLDDQYDYISAYVNDGPEDPPKRNGYGQGRFATNLEDGELR